MLETIGKYRPYLKGPITSSMGEKYLPMAVAASKESIGLFLEFCKISSCTPMNGAWMDRKGRSIINLILNSYSETMFYELENTLKDIHDGFFIYNMINIIEKIREGCAEQVVTNNASNNIAAARLLVGRRPSIFWTFYGATVNIMQKDIAVIKQS